LEFAPATPMLGSANSLTISGSWPNSCPPVAATIQFEPALEPVRTARRAIVQLMPPQIFRACLSPPVPYALQIADVQFPSAGEFRFEMRDLAAIPLQGQLRGTQHVRVASPTQAVSTFALSGTWYEAQNSGSGLILSQIKDAQRDQVFGTWHNYQRGGRASWYALQGGRWESPTRYRGDIYELRAEPYGVCRAIGCGIVLPPSAATQRLRLGSYRIEMQSATRAQLVFESSAGVIQLEKLL
jgi:hypothetical protein